MKTKKTKSLKTEMKTKSSQRLCGACSSPLRAGQVDLCGDCWMIGIGLGAAGATGGGELIPDTLEEKVRIEQVKLWMKQKTTTLYIPTVRVRRRTES